MFFAFRTPKICFESTITTARVSFRKPKKPSADASDHKLELAYDWEFREYCNNDNRME